MKVIVLGAGLIGGPMAADLAREERFQVSVADIDAAALQRLKRDHPLETFIRDLSDPREVTALVQEYDLVLSAVPGFMGFETLRAVIEAGRDVVDIAFFPEDPFLLHRLAKERGVTAMVDCGVAPGMSNILAGYIDQRMEETERIVIYVGGLPENREWPYEYKAVFSPLDVIEEYTRPARYIENGRLITKPALSEPELIDFPPLGTLEAFNSDGLRTLARTIKAPHLKEKTLRYPGHIEKMAVLRETGFFDQQEIEINGARIRPLDFTARLLFPKWKLEEGEIDITLMRIMAEGKKDGSRIRFTYDLYDRYDQSTRVHSMARTTGYTATCVLRLLSAGLYREKGISPPEFIGKRPECVDFILEGLRERGINYREGVQKLDG
ncbi:MAG: saccharopine dehydrogenase NADP-binding domain-containing protein [Candidatus Krumholzibacteriota bacterium]|nr:saccharopine dehydrogenase NADP-binding domain-containing protein [Candidatus Krumholzibacteriota bacterium]